MSTLPKCKKECVVDIKDMESKKPIYSKEMLEPFLKPFLEVKKRVREEYTKYGNNLDDYIKRKTEEIQKELLELDIV